MNATAVPPVCRVLGGYPFDSAMVVAAEYPGWWVSRLLNETVRGGYQTLITASFWAVAWFLRRFVNASPGVSLVVGRRRIRMSGT